jgi:hypothetical protein
MPDTQPNRSLVHQGEILPPAPSSTGQGSGFAGADRGGHSGPRRGAGAGKKGHLRRHLARLQGRLDAFFAVVRRTGLSRCPPRRRPSGLISPAWPIATHPPPSADGWPHSEKCTASTATHRRVGGVVHFLSILGCTGARKPPASGGWILVSRAPRSGGASVPAGKISATLRQSANSEPRPSSTGIVSSCLSVLAKGIIQ